MTPPSPEVAEIARKLTKAQLALLVSVSSSLFDGSYFRPDEGQSHNVFAALAGTGIFGRERFGDMGTLYWITPLGLAVRAHLEGKSNNG